jgi:protein TonB
MTLGPGSLASVAIHAASVCLLLVVPFVAQAPNPEPRPSPPVVGTGLVAAAARVRRDSRPTPTRPAPRSKARLAQAPAIPPPADDRDVAPLPAESIDDQACSGCVFASTTDDLPGTGGGGESRSEGDAAPSAATPGVLRVSAGVEAPRKLVHVDPIYPELARLSGVQGIVRLECTIDPSGNVAGLVMKSGHPLLVPAAQSAVRQWRYSPTRLNGVPVAVLMTVTVSFTLPR